MIFDEDYAPATQVMALLPALVNFCHHYVFKSPVVGIDVSAAFGGHFYHLLLNQLAFESFGDLLLGVGLMHHFRVFEQRMGTAKFLSFAIYSALASLGLQYGCMLVMSTLGEGYNLRLASGPYCYIFPFFVQYFAFIPKTHIGRIMGVEVSQKTFVYICGLLLVFGRGGQAFFPALCSIIGGLLFLSPRLGFSNYQLPLWLVSFGKNFVSPWIFPKLPPVRFFGRNKFSTQGQSDLPQSARLNQRESLLYNGTYESGNNGAAGEQLIPDRGIFDGGFHTNEMPLPAVRQTIGEPSEEKISTLTDLGVDRHTAIFALKRHQNDVERAANSLF